MKTKTIIIILTGFVIVWFGPVVFRDEIHSLSNRFHGRVEPDISTKELAKSKLDELSSMMGIQFPKSTILLNIIEDRFRDTIISFKAQIDPGEIEDLLKSPVFDKANWKSPESYPEHFFTTHSYLDWWKTKHVQKWETGDIELPQNAQSCRILIDYDHQDIVIVYFKYFVT